MFKMPFHSSVPFNLYGMLQPLYRDRCVEIQNVCHIYMLGNNGHTRCAYTAPHGLIRLIASPWLHACRYIALTCMYDGKRF